MRRPQLDIQMKNGRAFPLFSSPPSDVERINCLGFSLISHFAADRRDGRRGGKRGRHIKARPAGGEARFRLHRFALLICSGNLKI